jgi:hypothetical protein
MSVIKDVPTKRKVGKAEYGEGKEAIGNISRRRPIPEMENLRS